MRDTSKQDNNTEDETLDTNSLITTRKMRDTSNEVVLITTQKMRDTSNKQRGCFDNNTEDERH